jgi:hypothetical protein
MTVNHGGLVFVLFWGVLFFGGLTIITHVFVEMVSAHKSLSTSLSIGIVIEKLIGGLIWGSIMWSLDIWLFRDARKKRESNQNGAPR